jgi:hypothetical protein
MTFSTQEINKLLKTVEALQRNQEFYTVCQKFREVVMTYQTLCPLFSPSGIWRPIQSPP